MGHSFIPILTRNHPNVLKAKQEYPENSDQVMNAIERVGNTLSTHEKALSNGLTLPMLLTFGIIQWKFGDPDSWLMILASAGAGIWGLVFLILPLIYLKNRPGPVFPTNENRFLYSWKRCSSFFGSLLD